MKKVDYKSASFEKLKRTHAKSVRLRYTSVFSASWRIRPDKTPQQAKKRIRKGARLEKRKNNNP